MRSCFLFLFFTVVPAQAGDYLPPQLVAYPLPTQVVADAPRRVVQYDCFGEQCRPVSNYPAVPDSSPVSPNAPDLPPCPCMTQQGYCACFPAKAAVAPKASQSQASGSCSSVSSGFCGSFGGERRFRPVRGLLSRLFGGG